MLSLGMKVLATELPAHLEFRPYAYLSPARPNAVADRLKNLLVRKGAGKEARAITFMKMHSWEKILSRAMNEKAKTENEL